MGKMKKIILTFFIFTFIGISGIYTYDYLLTEKLGQEFLDDFQKLKPDSDSIDYGA